MPFYDLIYFSEQANTALFKQNALNSKKESIFLIKTKVGPIIIRILPKSLSNSEIANGKAFQLSPEF